MSEQSTRDFLIEAAIALAMMAAAAYAVTRDAGRARMTRLLTRLP
jgi:hypothetical protein